jgi:hypothetical protein
MLTKTGLSDTAEPSSLPENFDPEDSLPTITYHCFEVWSVDRSKLGDKGSDSKYSLLLECFELSESEESIQLEGDVHVSAGGCRTDRCFGSGSAGALYLMQSLSFHFAP